MRPCEKVRLQCTHSPKQAACGTSGNSLLVQGKGYGKAALKLILDYIEEKPFGNSDRVVLTCNKNNTYALNMYKSLGFEMTGNEDEDELELALTV